MDFYHDFKIYAAAKSNSHGHVNYTPTVSETLMGDATAVACTFQLEGRFVLDVKIKLKSPLSGTGDYVVSGPAVERQVLIFPSDDAYTHVTKTKKCSECGILDASSTRVEAALALREMRLDARRGVQF